MSRLKDNFPETLIPYTKFVKGSGRSHRGCLHRGTAVPPVSEIEAVNNLSFFEEADG